MFWQFFLKFFYLRIIHWCIIYLIKFFFLVKFANRKSFYNINLNNEAVKLQIIFWKENKSEFNRHLQRIPKPISNQSFFIWFQSYWYWTVKQEMKSKASHSGDILRERNLGPNLTVKMPEITQSIYCLYV